MFFVHLKENPAVTLFAFAHYELTLNPFCQHCSNKILILIFVIRRKLFSVLLKQFPYVKIQIFRDTSFMWFLNYFLPNFFKI